MVSNGKAFYSFLQHKSKSSSLLSCNTEIDPTERSVTCDPERGQGLPWACLAPIISIGKVAFSDFVWVGEGHILHALHADDSKCPDYVFRLGYPKNIYRGFQWGRGWSLAEKVKREKIFDYSHFIPVIFPQKMNIWVYRNWNCGYTDSVIYR